jgi:hypothetical protein
VTHSERLKVNDGTRTLKAAWKTIDERQRGLDSRLHSGYPTDPIG